MKTKSHVTKTAKKNVKTTTAKRVRTQAKKSLLSSIVLKKILVPIDFSEHSKKALQYAIPFAKAFQASLTLLYVVEPTVYPADFSFGQIGFPDIEAELREKGERELHTLANETIHGVVPSATIVKVGLPFVEVISYAQKEEIDLIVAATHGHTGVEHILFGSTVEKIVRKAPCPVLVVRTDEHDFINERV